MLKLSEIILAPHETEKAHQNPKAGTHVFKVATRATKSLVKQALEKYYGLKIATVRITKIQPKKRSLRNRIIQKRAPGKKAIVQTVGEKAIDVNQIKVK